MLKTGTKLMGKNSPMSKRTVAEIRTLYWGDIVYRFCGETTWHTEEEIMGRYDPLPAKDNQE